MINTCIVDDCDYCVSNYDCEKKNCFFHLQLKNIATNPLICTIQKCVNKCKTKNSLHYCPKHIKHKYTCCFEYCQRVCLRSNIYCTRHKKKVFICAKNQCNEKDLIDENGLCFKHLSNESICCEPYCFEESEFYGDFCMKHLKRNSLCKLEGCFINTTWVRNDYCHRHMANINACFVKSCSTNAVHDGVCGRHLQYYFKVVGSEKKNKKRKRQLSFKELMSRDLFTDEFDKDMVYYGENIDFKSIFI